VLDVCDLAAGAPDCDLNGVPDSCDIAGGSPDGDQNGVPDICQSGGAPFLRGNCNNDASISISDPIFLLEFLFAGGVAPFCGSACDLNDSGNIDLSDAIFSLTFLFVGGAPPPPPYPACDADPTLDSTQCPVGAACP